MPPSGRDLPLTIGTIMMHVKKADICASVYTCTLYMKAYI